MTKPAVKKGLEILSNCHNIDALRRLIVMTIVGRNLRPVSANEVTPADDSLSALLSRLPTKTLAEVAAISKGKTGIKDALPGPFPLVVTAETRSSADHFDFEGPAVMIPMVSSTGHGDASLKRIHFQDGQYAVGSILAVVHPKDSSVLSARYLHAYLSAFKDELLVSRMVGTANVSLTVAKIGDVPVPLLPIQGQQEIAELMVLCDQLEAEQADAASANARLVETLLGTLTQSTDAADLAANWQRLAEHFDPLFATEASIEALEQTVLQLAVMGKLVPQDPNDEPASGLLKRIVQERLRFEAEGTCKKSKPVPPVGNDEQPYALPEGWRWVRLPEVCHVITDGEHITPQYADSGVPMLSAKHLGTDTLLFDDLKFVTPTVADKCWSRCCPEERDILVVSRGGGVGRTIISGTRGYCLMGSVLLFKPATEVNERYLRSYLCSNEGNDKLRTTSGASAQQAIYIAHLKRDYVLPLPPLAEQHRIVAKVDELMALCNRLKADLATARQQQATLANTLIEFALESA